MNSEFSRCPSRDGHVRRICIVLAALMLSPGRASGQSVYGTITGSVTDSTRAAVVNAHVAATDPTTGFTRDTVTNSTGVYTLPNLVPGTYTVTVTAPGFQTYTRTEVIVTVQTLTRVDAMLAIGGVNETVTVSADAATLQTDRADVHSEVTAQILNNAPVPIGRNYQMLFVTIPGVSPPQSGHSFGANPTRSVAFTVNGGSVNSNDTRVDGAGTRNFAAPDTNQYVPAMEAIEAVSVATGSFDADQSTGGGFINVSIKNGTNDLHGSLFENHADRSLGAYPWLGDRTKPKLPFINNQFGGTIGGPIRKNKLFYFVSYDGTRLVQGNAVVGQVPTVAMKAGDLSASPTPIYDPLTGNPNGSGRTPFGGNIIPSSRIDSGIQALLATGSWPNPNKGGTGAFGLGQDFLCSGCQGSSGARRDQWDAKLNWNPSRKLSMFARIGFNNSSWYDPQILGLLGGPAVSPSNGAVGVGGAHLFNGTVSATYVFTPSLFVDAYFGYDRNDMFSNQPNQDKNLAWTMLRIPGLDTSSLPANRRPLQNGMPLIAIDGFTTLGPANQYQPQRYRDPERNYDASINWQKGAHNFRGGFEADLQDANEVQYEIIGNGFVTNAGGFHFAQGTTQLQGGPAGNDFNAFASFLLGLPQEAGRINLFRQINVPPDQMDEFSIREKSYSAYFRDRWQGSSKLTVSYGFRADYFRFPRRAGTGVEYYNPQNNTMVICGVGSVPADCGITRNRTFVTPRLGLAYRITNSTVLRAGYSMVADPIFFEGHSQSGRENFPYLSAQLLLPPNSLSYSTTLRQGLPAVPTPDLSTGAVPIPGFAFAETYDNSNYVRGYIQTWNFTVEQRVRNWAASAAYLETRYVDAQSNLQMNWSPINGGTAGQILNRVNGRTASTLYMGTMGTNTYDGLQTHLQSHFAGGYQVGVTYAFSKGLGYATSAPVQIPDSWRKNRGPLATDITHALSAVAIAELPFGQGKRWAQNGVPSKLAGGWQISGLLVAHSGPPFTAGATGATLNAPYSSQFADCISSPQQLGSILQWYSRSAFGVPSAGRFGTCGTNSLRGPGLLNADLGLQRKFPISERVQLSFRTEIFNIANTPHHSMSSTSVNSGTFLQAFSIANTGREGIEQRALRFALRLAW
jgi:hypothetical protein